MIASRRLEIIFIDTMHLINQKIRQHESQPGNRPTILSQSYLASVEKILKNSNSNKGIEAKLISTVYSDLSMSINEFNNTYTSLFGNDLCRRIQVLNQLISLYRTNDFDLN